MLKSLASCTKLSMKMSLEHRFVLKDFYKHGACSVTQDAGICCVGQRDNDLAAGCSRDGERWIKMQELPEA